MLALLILEYISEKFLKPKKTFEQKILTKIFIGLTNFTA